MAAMPAAAPVRPDSADPTGGATFANTLRSEWTKLRTVRSTIWTLAIAALLIVAIGVLVAKASVDESGPATDVVSSSLVGLFIAQLAVVALGVLTISAEYTTGMIRTSLMAQPRRTVLLAAKAVAFALVTFVVGTGAGLVAYLIAQAVSGGPGGGSVAVGLRAVVFGGLYLVLIGLMALGAGAILRSTAGGITLALGLLFLPATFGGLLPGSLGEAVQRYNPLNAGTAVTSTMQIPGGLSPWLGLCVAGAYAAVLLAGAFLLIDRRDA